ncbi:RNA binding protein (nucleomorph) [Lotharella oceanica]|uniref:RNA binding protein n=1 Tax=Lotharella oceanica TaxID=641309 RepID=A0A060D7Q9_9EUKA|nr:RNA binding protein [Lotharella oceanica]
MNRNPIILTLNQKSQIDYIKTAIKENIWYYRDRLNISRGPCDIYLLRKCWINGIIDQNTLIWGIGLDDWVPLRNIRNLIILIRIPEVQIATLIKKELIIKPSLNNVRDLNKSRRNTWLNQIEEMF